MTASDFRGALTGDSDEAFERTRRHWNVEGFRTAAITAIPLIVLSTPIEEVLEIPRSFERNALRITCLILLVLGLLFTERRKQLAVAYIDLMMPVIFVWIGFFCVRLMLLHDGYESPYFLTLAFCVVGVPVVTLWRPGLLFAYEVALLLLYLAPLALGVASVQLGETFLVRLYFLLGLMVIAAAAQWMHNRMVRRDVYARTRLTAASRRIAGMKAQRLSWLESLAGFLRHELRNQMVAIGTSLDMMQGSEASADRARYVERARRSLGRMGRLVSSATEATSLEAALVSEAHGIVDFSTVVEDRVVSFRQTFEQHNFATNIGSGIGIDGSEDRLAQMLDKLLSNAVEHAAEGGEIRVALRSEGQEAILTIENDGDPLPANGEELFNAFVSVGKESRNLGLGLFITRVIAESLSGRVVAEDLPGHTGARFVVMLPLRADPGTTT